MIRKAIIVLLILAAATVAYLSGASVSVSNYPQVITVSDDPRPVLPNLYIEGSHLVIEGELKVRSAPSRPTVPRVLNLGPFLGFQWQSFSRGAGWRYHSRMPIWSVVLSLLTYPLLTGARGPLRRRYRLRRGLCLNCGYDLKGNVSGICPECGESLLQSRKQRGLSKRQRRVMRYGKVLCVVLLPVWLVSAKIGITYASAGGFTVRVAFGRACFMTTAAYHPSVKWWERSAVRYYRDWRIAWFHLNDRGDLAIPLWIPLVLVAIPTVRLWWRHRRHPTGCCYKCGYDLTGNVSGVCSDCGVAV